MKRLIPLLLLSPLFSTAQEPADALRFSYYVPGASARVQAIGGAMGSLGGDITALYINPAGLGFYRTGDFVISPQFGWGKTNATFNGNKVKEDYSRLSLGTTGFVFGDGNDNKKVRAAGFGLAFNRTADFTSHFAYRGANTQSSYSERFLEEINNGGIKDGNYVANEFPYGASLAFNTGWIDTVGGGTNGNFAFQSRAKPLLAGAGLLQEQIVETRGGIYEFAIGGGVNLEDKLLLGATIGIPILSYTQDKTFAEADATDNSNNGFEDAVVVEEFSTKGVGFNLKAGVIYKPSEFWRIGFAAHSPTIYSMTNRDYVTITTNTETLNGMLTQNTQDITGVPSEFKYLHVTPYRLIGSVSFVLREVADVTKQRGFITADVEYINYTSSSYLTDPDSENDATTEAYLKGLNTAINQAYKGTFNFRAGAELKFTTIMVRLGGAYYGNPYKDIKGENGHRLNLTGGLGYRDKGFFVDLSYVHSMSEDVHYAYRLQNGNYSGANLSTTAGQVFATVGVKF